MRTETPDVVLVQFKGPMTLEHANCLYEILHAEIANRPIYVLANMREGGIATRDAREYIAKHFDLDRIVAVATYGASFHEGTIVAMMVKAMRIFGKKIPELKFFHSESEARTWITLLHRMN